MTIRHLYVLLLSLSLAGCLPGARTATTEERAIVQAALMGRATPERPDQLVCVHWAWDSSLEFTGYMGAKLAERGLAVPSAFNGRALEAPDFGFSTSPNVRGNWVRYETPGPIARLLWSCADRVEVALVHRTQTVAFVGMRRNSHDMEAANIPPRGAMVRLERSGRSWRVSDVENFGPRLVY
jgi:hypothetical protein